MLNKKKNKIRKLMIITITLTLCLSAIQISAISKSNNQSKSESITPVFIFKKDENFQPQLITKSLSSKTNEKVGLLATDFLIYGSEEEGIICQNPTVTDDLAQKVLIGFDLYPGTIYPPDPYFRFSNDGGLTWLPEDSAFGWTLTEQDYSSILPNVDFSGDKGGFGTVLPFDQNNWITINFPDITDPEAGTTWIANGWLADVMMEEWHTVHVCGVNSEYAPVEDAQGIAVWTGNTVDGGDNGLWYGWERAEGSEFVVLPEESDPGYDFEADQAVNDVDLTSGMYYQAFYRYDDVGEDPLVDGVSLRRVQLDGTEDWVNSWTDIDHIINVEHPDIKADSGNCYLVYENWYGIECYYSNDNGVSFQTSTVAPNGGSFPSVTAIDENVVVTYTKEGDLYTAISEDGGATWLEKPLVNDIPGSVVEQNHCADVSGLHIAWTDNRLSERNFGIYYDQAEFPIPIIEIESISGGFGISASITNSGTADATNIDWRITFDGGVFVGQEKTGTIASLSPGQSVTIRSGFVFGLGGTEVTITASSATQRVSGTAFLFLILGI